MAPLHHQRFSYLTYSVPRFRDFEPQMIPASRSPYLARSRMDSCVFLLMIFSSLIVTFAAYPPVDPYGAPRGRRGPRRMSSCGSLLMTFYDPHLHINLQLILRWIHILHRNKWIHVRCLTVTKCSHRNIIYSLSSVCCTKSDVFM